MLNEPNPYLLLYGSQTGQSQAIAEELKEKSEACGISVRLHCLSHVDNEFILEQENLVVFIIATTGDGEFPDTVTKIYRRLRKRTLSRTHLKSLRYSLLALGDSNYTNFCKAGKTFDQRLQDLGAVKFIKTAYADDAVGLEVAVEPWLDEVLLFLRKEFNISENISNIIQDPMEGAANNMADISLLKPSSALKDLELTVPSLPNRFVEVKYLQETIISNNYDPLNGTVLPSSASKLVKAEMMDFKCFTNSEKVKEIYEMKIKILDPEIQYQPGDAFGILCRNHPSEVVKILQHLGLESKMNVPLSLKCCVENKKIPKHLPETSSLFQLLSQFCEIRSVPKKAFLRSLAEYTTDEKEKRRLMELCSRQGANDYAKCIRENQTCFLDLIRKFPSCKPPVETLLENFPQLQPRYYSVSSSPLENVDQSIFTVIFSLISFPETEDRCKRNGVCTGYFKNQFLTEGPIDEENLVNKFSKLSLQSELEIYKRTNQNFFMPVDLTIPLIMIGPGTGVAPFIGFLNHRKKLIERQPESTSAETWLFFGCRHKELDYIYRDDIESLLKENVLSHLCLSFSRDTDSQHRYVQDSIRAHGNALVKLIKDKNAQVFVCGDARNMAKDVAASLTLCHQEVIGSTSTEASNWLKDLQEKKRYVQDVWL